MPDGSASEPPEEVQARLIQARRRPGTSVLICTSVPGSQHGEQCRHVRPGHPETPDHLRQRLRASRETESR